MKKLGIVLGTIFISNIAMAQSVIDEVLVTATKKVQSESVQDVPFSMTAFGAKELDAAHVRNLTSLSYVMPNVHLEKHSGTSAATANFSIRGLGINSTIPSIDPTVGVVVDGVYMGITAGVLFDTFDLEAVEVLRGPQGVLFGRNVTGGAVLLRTKAPGDTFAMSGRFAVETGPQYIADATITGPLIDETLSAKLAVYHSDDEGYFRNEFDGRRFGEGRQTIVRPALRWSLPANAEINLRLEHGETDGDGPAGQNHALFHRDSFDFSIDNGGSSDSEWNQAFLEGRLPVEFGDGELTNILGWREFETSSDVDIDATSNAAFHGQLFIDQDQLSEELRYAGTFGAVQVTTGLYYFQQDLLYVERRLLANGRVDRAGGGDGDFSTHAVFGSADWSITSQVTLNAGLRYTEERKDALVSTIRAGGGSVADKTIVPDFVGKDQWDDFSPRLGFQWRPVSDSQIYGYWAKGFRSGGFNFRNTDPGVTPGPFDAEEQRSFELGVKQDLLDRTVRINLAAFHNTIDRVQREINVPGALGVTQIIRNVGEATVRGAEIEAYLRATLQLTLSAQAGYTHGEYDSVVFDLNGDGQVNDSDRRLDFPRLSPWTYGIGASHDVGLGQWGDFSSRLSFNHRDSSVYTDSNLGVLNAADMLDIHVTWTPEGSALSIAVYGTNLLDEVTFHGDTPLPDAPDFGGGAGRPIPTFSPLNKGRVVGAQVSMKL